MKLRYMNESNLPDNVSPLDKHFYPDEPKFDPDNVSYAKVSYVGRSVDDPSEEFEETIDVNQKDVRGFGISFADYMSNKEDVMGVITKLLSDDGIVPIQVDEIVLVDRDGDGFIIGENGEVSLYKW